MDYFTFSRPAGLRPSDGARLTLQGDWTIPNLAAITTALNKLPVDSGRLIVDGSGLHELTLSAAAVLQSWRAAVKQRGTDTQLENFPDKQQRLLDMLPRDADFEKQVRLQPSGRGFVSAVGKSVYQVTHGMGAFLTFLGQAVSGLARYAVMPWRVRTTSIVFHVYEVGIRATPIVVLMSFLISIVIGYQGVSQLRQFGAEIYSIDLVAVSLLRELGILVTAIMVAGRSGSAFTAELGVMKVNEEVDALSAMGLDPFEILVMPRLVAILIALPLLAIIADFAGLFGGFIMATSVLHFSPEQYFDRLHQALKLKSVVLGLLKAPFFALLIGIIGCLRGFQVSGAAESVGRFTTQAVVDSIFLVITVDAVFSVIYSYLGY